MRLLLLLTISAPLWAQCGPGQVRRSVGQGYVCVNTSNVVVKDTACPGGAPSGSVCAAGNVYAGGSPVGGYTFQVNGSTVGTRAKVNMATGSGVSIAGADNGSDAVTYTFSWTGIGDAGTVKPATCSVGAQFLKTDETAGNNFYLCTSTNTWTRVGSAAVVGPASNTDNYIPQWSGANSGTLKDGLALSTAIASPGVDTKVPTEKAVRDLADTLLGAVLNYQTTLSNVTLTGGEDTLYTYTLPSGTLTAGGCVEITASYKKASGSGGISPKFYFGATSVLQPANASTSNSQWFTTLRVCNKPGSTTAQHTMIINSLLGGNVSIYTFQDSAVSMGSNQTIKATVTGTNGDTVTPIYWMVRKIG